jgi:hypothetical protein
MPCAYFRLKLLHFTCQKFHRIRTRLRPQTMRLLNSSTIELEEPGSKNLEYAILSHTWGENEISFQDLQNLSEDKKDSEGYKKIKSCCTQAHSDGWEYVWIDTACIDKTSSSELSEAINSMYLWYRNAQVCYAYLADVPSGQEHQSNGSRFRNSKWFTRGWTLQELLAPLYLVFFGQDWVEIGTKASLREAISEVTGISSQVLLVNYAGETSVAQRMSWASKRKTTRVEDEAYCLMGIFGVNMPMLYGEGQNAFIRLQLEILKLSDDHTIFAWMGNAKDGNERGLLAHSPKEFANCGNVCQFDTDTLRSPYSMTNRGLHIELPLIPMYKDPERDLFLAVLNCQFRGDSRPLAIYLKRAQEEQFGQRVKFRQGEQSINYVRVLPENIIPVDKNLSFVKKSEVYIKEKDLSRFDVLQWMKPQEQYLFSVKTLPSHEHSFFLSKVHPKDMWKAREEGLRLTIGASGTCGALMFRNDSEEMFIVAIRTYNCNVWSDIVTDFGKETIADIRDSYFRGGKGARINRLLHSLDRITKTLPGGKSAFVAIRKGKISSGKRYLVEIIVN